MARKNYSKNFINVKTSGNFWGEKEEQLVKDQKFKRMDEASKDLWMALYAIALGVYQRYFLKAFKSTRMEEHVTECAEHLLEVCNLYDASRGKAYSMMTRSAVIFYYGKNKIDKHCIKIPGEKKKKIVKRLYSLESLKSIGNNNEQLDTNDSNAFHIQDREQESIIARDGIDELASYEYIEKIKKILRSADVLVPEYFGNGLCKIDNTIERVKKVSKILLFCLDNPDILDKSIKDLTVVGGRPSMTQINSFMIGAIMSKSDMSKRHALIAMKETIEFLKFELAEERLDENV